MLSAELLLPVQSAVAVAMLLTLLSVAAAPAASVILSCAAAYVSPSCRYRACACSHARTDFWLLDHKAKPGQCLLVFVGLLEL